jgi:hypothetical protein
MLCIVLGLAIFLWMRDWEQVKLSGLKGNSLKRWGRGSGEVPVADQEEVQYKASFEQV